MLKGVADFMRCDRRCCDRAAGKVFLGQPHGAVFGAVVIAAVGFLDAHAGEAEVGDQMLGELAAGAWIVGAVGGVGGERCGAPRGAGRG